MKFFSELACGGRTILSTRRPWLLFLACAAVMALLIATLQRADAARSPHFLPAAPSATSDRPVMLGPAFVLTVAAAAKSHAVRHDSGIGKR
jgi:hypothetical protein